MANDGNKKEKIVSGPLSHDHGVSPSVKKELDEVKARIEKLENPPAPKV